MIVMNNFQLIIKNPQASLTDIENVNWSATTTEKIAIKLQISLGDFINLVYTAYSGKNQVAKDNRVVYSGLHLIQDDEIRIGLRGNAAQYDHFCTLLHSVRAMQDGIAKRLSSDGIFGLKPDLESTSFAVAWIKSFLGSVFESAGSHLELSRKMKGSGRKMNSWAVAGYMVVGALVGALLAQGAVTLGSSKLLQSLIGKSSHMNAVLNKKALQNIMSTLLGIYTAFRGFSFTPESRKQVIGKIPELTTTLDDVKTKFSEFVNEHLTETPTDIATQKAGELFLRLFHASEIVGEFLTISEAYYEEYVKSMRKFTVCAGMAGGAVAFGLVKFTPGLWSIFGGVVAIASATGSVIYKDINRRNISTVIDQTLAVHRFCVITYITIGLYYEDDSNATIRQAVDKRRKRLEDILTELGHVGLHLSQEPHERFRVTLMEYQKDLDAFNKSVKEGLLEKL